VLPQEIPAGLDVTVPVPVPVGVTYSVNCGAAWSVNVAVQLLLAVSVNDELALVPVHLPDQPPKTEPDAAAAVRVTAVLAAKDVLQVLPHETPAGLDVTVPEPVPAFATDTVYCTGALTVNVATHVALELTVLLTEALVPLQLPDQPLKVDPDAAAADNVTTLPVRNRCVQSLPHEMPDGEEFTLPAPLPDKLTVSRE
jgi:hypothetical protein